MKYENLRVDLSGIELQDIEVLAQEGARAIPDFAASTSSCTHNCCGTSTSTGDEVEEEA
jgi:hypothetical protein